MKNKALILVDGQNAAWRAYHAYSRLSYKGKGVGMMYGLPSIIGGLINRFDPYDLIVVWEGKKSPVRMRHNPEYKEHRKSKSLIDYEDFLEQKRWAMNVLQLLGVSQASNPNMEGDDLLYKIWDISKNNDDYSQIIIVSSDKDFNQMIGFDKKLGRSTVVFNEQKKELITETNCKRLFGYEARQTIDYLTLVGDSTDNIPGYRGIGEKKAIQLLEKYSSLARFLDSGDKHPIIERKSLLELIKSAQIMINLQYHYENYIKGIDRFRIYWHGNDMRPDPNLKEFKKIVARFNMNRLLGASFLKQFDL